jgi:transglutaminase-like putative cysteine protease
LPLQIGYRLSAINMYYSIRHKTRFRYSAPVSESFLEVRMQPRSEGAQRCIEFKLSTTPSAHVLSYRDYLGNIVHHFDIPAQHKQLTVTAEALVEFSPPPVLPIALDAAEWEAIDQLAHSAEIYDFLTPSRFAKPTPLLHKLAREIEAHRRDDPLSLLRQINGAIYEIFDYAPQSTRVDSPIDEALQARKGVCQDFAHIMTTLVREVGIPCRYVSGYLFHGGQNRDRSSEDATHAWVEALLPSLGWVGFDPTNNLLAGSRHIRAAVGRDYADVPPTRGGYRGDATNTIEVGVRVSPTSAPAAPATPPVAEEEPDMQPYGMVVPIVSDALQSQMEQQ